MRRALVAVVLLAVAGSLSAAPEDFHNVVDFSISTAELVNRVRAFAAADESYTPVEPGKYMILEGSVASSTLYDPSAEAFYAEIELVSGEWQSLERIEVHRVWVVLAGPEFAGRVVERLPRDPGPEIILANSKITVVCAYAGWIEGIDGRPEPAVIAIAVR